VNAQLVAEGLASMQATGEDEEIPEEVNGWFDLEEEARES
jgi:hypothetical protein